MRAALDTPTAGGWAPLHYLAAMWDFYLGATPESRDDVRQAWLDSMRIQGWRSYILYQGLMPTHPRDIYVLSRAGKWPRLEILAPRTKQSSV